MTAPHNGGGEGFDGAEVADGGGGRRYGGCLTSENFQDVFEGSELYVSGLGHLNFLQGGNFQGVLTDPLGR